MRNTLSELAPAVARDLADVLELPVAVSDSAGRVLAATGWAPSFCPIVAGPTPPALLPPRCAECARLEGWLRCEDRLAPCPDGHDAICPIEVEGHTVGWLATAVFPKEFGSVAVERAHKAFRLTALLLGAAIASERRTGTEVGSAARSLAAASDRAARALEALPAGAPGRCDVEAAASELEEARVRLDALLKAPGGAPPPHPDGTRPSLAPAGTAAPRVAAPST